MMIGFFFSVSPKGSPSLTVSADVIAVNKEVTFTCNASSLISQPQVNKYIFYNSTSQVAEEDVSFWTTSFSSILNSGAYHCVARNNIGNGDDQSNTETVTVQGNLTYLYFIISSLSL